MLGPEAMECFLEVALWKLILPDGSTSNLAAFAY